MFADTRSLDVGCVERTTQTHVYWFADTRLLVFDYAPIAFVKWSLEFYGRTRILGRCPTPGTPRWFVFSDVARTPNIGNKGDVGNKGHVGRGLVNRCPTPGTPNAFLNPHVGRGLVNRCPTPGTPYAFLNPHVGRGLVNRCPTPGTAKRILWTPMTHDAKEKKFKQTRLKRIVNKYYIFYFLFCLFFFFAS